MNNITLPQLIFELGLVKSRGVAKDLMKAGAISLDAVRMHDAAEVFTLSQLRGKTLRVGKHKLVTLGAVLDLAFPPAEEP